MSTAQLSPGTVVDGRFTVGNVLRTRHGACTYQATGPDHASVELTIYGAECFPSALVLERSLRELKQLQGLASERIVKVLEAGKHGDGIFEVTELAPGPTLAEHLSNGALPLADAAALVVQVGEALLEAQKAGVMHRNLGASVVFPSPQGVRVTGFAVGEPQAANSYGPLDTLAPEQVQGKVVDQRTLIYNVAALMHWMLAGSPLFTGTPGEILQAHAESEPQAHDALKRALSKDPRMRPMMLKQFLGDIASLGGVAPPRAPAARHVPAPKPAAPAGSVGGAKPSSRGWTMFLEDEGGGGAKPDAPAPAPAGKPSTRGWTMFMEAQDDSASEQAAKPDAPAPASKPSTRGWTMFMEADEQGSAAGASNEQTTPEQEAGASKPSTRGWTMFMEAQGEEGPAKADEPSSARAAKPAAPAPAGPASKPSTRGWTMFMEARDGESAAAESQEPSSSEPTQQPQQPSAPGATPAPKTPSSRGWTMFIEDGSSKAPPAAEPPAAEPPAAEPPAAATAEAGAPTPQEDAPSGPRRKGWTMFMDAPLQEVEKDIGGPKTPAPSMEADTKGWTVFGTPSPVAPKPEEAAPGERPNPDRPTLLVTKPMVPPARAVEPEARSGATVVSPAPQPGELDGSATPVKGKTVIASRVSTQAGPAGGVTGRTAYAEQGDKPDTMYFKRGEGEPARPSPRDPTVRDIEAPATAPAREAASAAPTVRPVHTGPNDVALDVPKSRAPLYIVAAVVVIGAAAGAVLALT